MKIEEGASASEIRPGDRVVLDGEVLTVVDRVARKTTYPRDESEKTITLWFAERSKPVSGLEGQRITKVLGAEEPPSAR